MRDGQFYKYWVYIMGSLTGTLYVGMTGFFDTRIGRHKSRIIEGFSKKYGCDRLLYYEGYDDVGRAKRREIQLKGWRREKKIKLIEQVNPRWQDLAEHWVRKCWHRDSPSSELLEARWQGTLPRDASTRLSSLRSVRLAQHSQSWHLRMESCTQVA